MKECLGCRYTEWKKTKSGRLHPSGDGRCKYQCNVPKLPTSMWWIGPIPRLGGAIPKKEGLR